MYSNYIIEWSNQCKTIHRTYNGMTNNIHRRFRQHNCEIVGGAVATSRMIKKYPGTKWKPIIIIENFPDKKFIRSNPNKISRNPMIIYHGHLAPERGITDLVLAIKEVAVKIPQVKLVLLGSFRIANYKKSINSLIKIHSLENHIIIKKQIPHEEVWEVLRNSSIGIIPFRENPLTKINTPTKLFEMMASGLSIVATDLPPIRNFIDDTVFWAKPSSPTSLAINILKSINNGDVKSKIEKNLKMINEKYNWEKIESRYLSIFN